MSYFSKTKRQIVGYAVITGALLILLYAGFRATSNYLGYCSETGERLSDEKKIRIAVDRLLRSYPPTLTEYITQPKNRKVIKWFRPENPIHYQSFGHFIEVNKGCCKVTYRDKGDFENEGRKISTIDRILGIRSSNVRIRYQVQYVDVNGNTATAETESYISVSNCGNQH